MDFSELQGHQKEASRLLKFKKCVKKCAQKSIIESSNTTERMAETDKILESLKAAQSAAEYAKIAEGGYASFGCGFAEGLQQYFTEDTEFRPMFPVPGWEVKKGFGEVMGQVRPEAKVMTSSEFA